MADGQECRATDGTLASYTKQVGLQVRYQQQYQRQAMHQDRNNDSSNMLHYSNASCIEKSRRYLVIKGGLAWLLWQERGVVNSVVERGSSNVGLGVYREKRGEKQ